ncbi:MAG TPA: rhodanese-like domain-containing protein [Bacteroidetes bacterium]|nr:rhodanese-like domain-containing protein [Bacteroidota bacterium]
MGKVKEGALLVDVRRHKEVDEVNFDVPNYLHIPLSQLEERMSEIPKDKDVVMVCRSGDRSLRATYYLMNHGYENVVNMKNGLLKWAAKGFPAKGNVQAFLDAASCDCSQPGCC